MNGDIRYKAMKQQRVESPAPLSGGFDRTVFLSQNRFKAETFDVRQFIDPNRQNYFE